MLMRIAVAAVIVAALPAHAQQQDGEQERDTLDGVVDRTDVIDEAEVVAPIEMRWEPGLAARVRAGGGAVGGGDTINPGSGALSLFDGELTPRLTRGRLAIEVPLEYTHRQTFNTNLTEIRARGGGRVTYRFTPAIRAAAELGLSATWKPGWSDPFQPLDTGGLATTDRYSHWDRRAGAEVVVRTSRHQRLRVAYDYVLAVYDHDPMFDPIYDPIHLTPWDRERNRVDASYRIKEGIWRFRGGLQVARWQYFFMFAGDANTGITHAGPGGEPPNPLLDLVVVKPRVEAEVKAHPSIGVRARYELEVMTDRFQGYLSYVGHHPEVEVRAALPSQVIVSAQAEVFWRRYGPNSYDYAMDPTRPPLAWGDRREERLWYFGLRAAKIFDDHWSAIAEAKVALRRTNYAYGINWDYVNWFAWTGAEYRY